MKAFIHWDNSNWPPHRTRVLYSQCLCGLLGCKIMWWHEEWSDLTVLNNYKYQIDFRQYLKGQYRTCLSRTLWRVWAAGVWKARLQWQMWLHPGRHQSTVNTGAHKSTPLPELTVCKTSIIKLPDVADICMYYVDANGWYYDIYHTFSEHIPYVVHAQDRFQPARADSLDPITINPQNAKVFLFKPRHQRVF